MDDDGFWGRGGKSKIDSGGKDSSRSGMIGMGFCVHQDWVLAFHSCR